MKKVIFTLFMIVSSVSVLAQNDTIYILNTGNVIGKYHVNDIDSMIFYMPQYTGEYVSDVEGNSYRTVMIAGKLWMSENLKTTKYNDGTPIPAEPDKDAWFALATPAYCWYENDSVSNFSSKGALYNWFVVGTEKLCPAGWHVPTDREWNDLEIALGMMESDTSGVGFRGTDHGSKLAGNSVSWVDGLLDEDDLFGLSGFNAFGSGNRSATGTYSSAGLNAYFWTSDLNFSNNGWGRYLSYQNTNVYRIAFNPRVGASVRCVQD